jgi:hypothetical protein
MNEAPPDRKLCALYCLGSRPILDIASLMISRNLVQLRRLEARAVAVVPRREA